MALVVVMMGVMIDDDDDAAADSIPPPWPWPQGRNTPSPLEGTLSTFPPTTGSASGGSLAPHPPCLSPHSQLPCLLPLRSGTGTALEGERPAGQMSSNSSLSFSWKQSRKTGLIQKSSTAMILPKASNRQTGQQVPGHSFSLLPQVLPLPGNLGWGKLTGLGTARRSLLSMQKKELRRRQLWIK